jgi:ABC-type transport system substrate-binding protein
MARTFVTRRRFVILMGGGAAAGLAAACAAPAAAPGPTAAPKAAEPAKPAAPTSAPSKTAESAKSADASKPAQPTSQAAPASKGAQAGGKATWAISGDPTCLAPFGILPGLAHEGKEMLFDSLVQWDRELTVQPALAEEWSTPDERTYLFKLRKGVKLHNGKELDAEDVKYSIELQGKPPQPGAPIPQYPQIESVDVVDAQTVKLNMKGLIRPSWAGSRGPAGAGSRPRGSTRAETRARAPMGRGRSSWSSTSATIVSCSPSTPITGRADSPTWTS